jgi:Tol biopolymer transport system component
MKIARLAILATLALTAAAPPGLPLKPARELKLDVHTGTWLSLDVAPDGRTILFDMLGDLYALPAAGGEARQLTSGLAFETQPTFAPDGQSIAFVCDATGADNLWLARPDGSGARAITHDDGEAIYASPAWSADGKAIFVSRYTADRNNYELVRVNLADGAVTMVAPIRKSPDEPRGSWRSNLGAATSRDGRFLYYARHAGGLDYDEINAWEIVRRDLASGTETVIIGGPVERGHERINAFRPALSPDGRNLAYAAHQGQATVLHLRDLASGADRSLGPLEPDQLEAALWQDIVPRYAFTPDGRAILLVRLGHFERIDVASGARRELPFHAAAHVAVGPSTRLALQEETGPVRARLAQAPIVSPDGGAVAFSALGHLYLADTGGKVPPRRLDTGALLAYQPSWSPDSQAVVFVSWNEEKGGAIWTVPADGSAPPRALTALPAFYTYPTFTPDGSRLLAFRSSFAARQSATFGIGRLRQSQLVALPAGGGAAQVLAEGMIGSRPHFAADPGKVVILGKDGLESVDLASGATTPVAQVKGPGYYFVEGDTPADDLRLSPDGKWILAQDGEQLWLLPTPPPGTTVDVTDPAAHAVKLTRRGADYFEFRRDGSIDWAVGSTLRHLAPAEFKPDAEAGARTLPLTVTVPRAQVRGSLLLRGATALTMAGGDRVIADADILVSDGRIARIGPRGSFAVPADVPVRDLTGRWVLPGFIDEHDHIAEIRRDVLSTEDWGLRARLAYGVTTSFDPSTLSIDMMPYQDMLDAGMMIGPRLRMTGPALFSFNRIASLDDAVAVLRRYREDYRLGNLKEYRTGNRRVRQWVAMAARAVGLQPTTEGALSLKLDLSQILDGYAGNEHTLAAGFLGDDVTGLMAAMRTSYATTMMTTHQGPEGFHWFAAETHAAEDAKLRRFWPPAALPKLTGMPWEPLAAYRFDIAGAGAARIAAAGGLVGMGAHGEVPGIGFHWEMWAHAISGEAGVGMPAMAVLHAATAGSAETIGRLADLGTLEPGKSADLVILTADPLADIRNTKAIAAVMLAGRLYDGETLDTLWPDAHPLPAPWFRDAGLVRQWLPVAPVKP